MCCLSDTPQSSKQRERGREGGIGGREGGREGGKEGGGRREGERERANVYREKFQIRKGQFYKTLYYKNRWPLYMYIIHQSSLSSK